MKKLFYGGDIITMEGEKKEVEAVLIEDGLIKNIGKISNLKSIPGDNLEDIEEIDLNGNTLIPAFIDPHSHISLLAKTLAMADLNECRNFSDIIAVLSKYKKENEIKDKEVIFGFGYDHNFLEEKVHPTKEVLNKVTKDNPIIIFHKSVHMGAVNDAALKLLGIDKNTEEPDGGVIGRIKGSREPNGYLEETPIMNLLENISKYTQADNFKLATKAQKEYIKNGITTVQDGLADKDSIDLFADLAKKNNLVVDVISYPIVIDKPNKIMKEYKKYVKNYVNNFKIGGYKLILDGSPQGKSAWLTEPYEGEENYRGYPWFDDDQANEFILTAINNNMQLLTHCNGDAAADQLLNNYERALKKSDNPNKYNLRPVMIHSQIVRDDQLDKMAQLGMIPSMFVAHTFYWGDVHLKNLGFKRGSRIDPAKSALDRNLCVNFHQDSPIVKPLMLHTIWSAVNRKTRKGKTIGHEEQISVYEALKAVTINAAYQYSEEGIKGSIKEGKLADLVILDKNPLKVDKMKIKDIKVVETIKEGKTIFKRDDIK